MLNNSPVSQIIKKCDELAEQGKFEDAVKLCDDALKINPDSYMVAGKRGSLLAHLGRLEEAIESFDTAIVSYDKALKTEVNVEAWYNTRIAINNLVK